MLIVKAEIFEIYKINLKRILTHLCIYFEQKLLNRFEKKSLKPNCCNLIQSHIKNSQQYLPLKTQKTNTLKKQTLHFIDGLFQELSKLFC